MKSADREGMINSLKEKNIKYIIVYLLENPLPKTDEEYYYSEWSKWIDRIAEGERVELACIDQMPAYNLDEVLEIFAEDVAKSEAISNDMYAALCVHLWSKIETSFRRCQEAWNLQYNSQMRSDTHKIKDVKNFFEDEASIQLPCIPNYNYANSVRVLSNCYKHNNGRYKPETYPIESSLLNQWGIENEQRIEYLRLPIKDILLHCGEFLEQLLKEFRQKIETRH